MITHKTEHAATRAIQDMGYTRDESDRYANWKNAAGDEAHVRKTEDGMWTVVTQTAAEVATAHQQATIASLLHHLHGDVEKGRDEAKEAIDRAIRMLTSVRERFTAVAAIQNQDEAADYLRHAMANAENEFANVARYMTDAATKSAVGAKAQEQLIKGAKYLVPMAPAGWTTLIREKLAEVHVVV